MVLGWGSVDVIRENVEVKGSSISSSVTLCLIFSTPDVWMCLSNFDLSLRKKKRFLNLMVLKLK